MSIDNKLRGIQVHRRRVWKYLNYISIGHRL